MKKEEQEQDADAAIDRVVHTIHVAVQLAQ